MGDVRIPSLSWLQRVTEMVRWWERLPRDLLAGLRRVSPASQEPASGFAKLTAELGTGGSATAVKRRWNEAGDEWEDTDEEITLHAGGNWVEGLSFPEGTYTEYRFVRDPKFPRFIATNPACEPEAEEEEE